MNGSERFAALLASLLSTVAIAVGGLRYLMLISWRIGKLLEQFADHVSDDDEIHRDIEARVRLLERGRRRP